MTTYAEKRRMIIWNMLEKDEHFWRFLKSWEGFPAVYDTWDMDEKAISEAPRITSRKFAFNEILFDC